LINNNRQAGRRRGRGGQRQGGNPNAGNGNRIDNRARGNAAQLLEKYKALASDAQRQGDRVNAEYYLQFADHYFRVLAESRSRFEEQNPNQGQRRGREDGFDDDGDEGFEDDGAPQADMDPRREQQARDDRPYRDEGRQEGRSEGRQDARPDRGNREPRANNGRDRDDRGNRAQGGNNGYANGNAYPANDGDADDNRGNAAEAPAEVRAEREAPRRGRPRREARPVESNEGETFDAAILPPALGISVGDEGEPAPKPRRGRPRRSPDAEAAE
jgi:hypothetical protein